MEAEERPSKIRKISLSYADQTEKALLTKAGYEAGNTYVESNTIPSTTGAESTERSSEENKSNVGPVCLSRDFNPTSHSKMQLHEHSLKLHESAASDEAATKAANTPSTKRETPDGKADESAGVLNSGMLAGGSPTNTEPPLSKNQLKKLKREQEWQASRDYRRAKRKEKIQQKKHRKHVAREGEDPTAVTAESNSTLTNVDHEAETQAKEPPKQAHLRSVQLPITFVFDCGFDDLMLDKERISLASQLTRCYSDNHHAPFKAHIAVSSFGGKLKDRFDNILSGHHQSWKGVRFLPEDFVEAAQRAKNWMDGPQGGVLAGTFAGKRTSSDSEEKLVDTWEPDTVYLTSDSPETLTELKPYSTYIIGGLVDRNRHKGICYKRAMDRGMKTARLPIGEYMEMTSRFVLATNHVSEIMLKWLELGDWGMAFLKVVPKRKGGVLKGRTAGDQLAISEETFEETVEESEKTGIASSGVEILPVG